MILSEIGIDAEGVMRSPNVHDGYLEGVYVGKARAVLHVRDVENQRFDLILEGLERLHATDFCQGNIIYEATIRRDRGITSSNVAQAFGQSLEDLQDKVFFRDVLSRLAAGDLCLVDLIPSYGCALTALCIRVSMRNRAGAPSAVDP